MNKPLNLVIDDEKTLNIVAGMIMPGPLFSSDEESAKLHEEHKVWIGNTFLVKDAKKGLTELKFHEWSAIYLDYDLREHKGTQITQFLRENRKRIPDDFYIISHNPYGRKLMFEDMKEFYAKHTYIDKVIHLSEKRK